MAFQNPAYMLPLIVLWLFFHSSSAAVTIHVSGNLVDAICQQTQNPEFCITTIKNYPRTGAASMDELGMITILLATAQARENEYVVNELLQNEKDDVTKMHLSHCLRDYRVALGHLRIAYRLSDQKNYKHMIKLVRDAMKMTNKCEDGFNEPPSRPFPLADYNQKMVWLNDIALVTLDLLDG